MGSGERRGTGGCAAGGLLRVVVVGEGGVAGGGVVGVVVGEGGMAGGDAVIVGLLLGRGFSSSSTSTMGGFCWPPQSTSVLCVGVGVCDEETKVGVLCTDWKQQHQHQQQLDNCGHTQSNVPAACRDAHIACNCNKQVVVHNVAAAIGMGRIVGHTVGDVGLNSLKHRDVEGVGGWVVTHCICQAGALHLGGIGWASFIGVGRGGVAVIRKG